MIEKILLASSGPGNTETMFKALLDIPMIQRSQVTVLKVVSPKSSAGNMGDQQSGSEQQLADTVSRLGIEASKVTPMLREGEPKDVVCRVADEIDADLIIMGSRGLGGLKAILKNSVSQYVFQLSSKPMLLVKDDLYGIRPVKRVLVALDKSDMAKESLKTAIDLTRDIKDSELIFVHTLSNLRSSIDEAINANPESDPVLAPAIAEAKRYRIDYRCVAPEGKPGQRICSLAEQLNVNLLILGSPDRRPSIAKGLPDIDRLLGSSLSDYVRINAPCPVLLTRIETN
ncbi:universal stress protein [Leptolyngbya cf. ectocarpi LEGE 11479]|uniref:Universal stress protein n=1 Tax=Leptolyngbya cf. ectocarpi LEGE 11479 TaxID=1828722 RepID=A0A928X4B6_LEPEC|nr:universal stress protein [Leptolyngbya ectocarpi]MBE9066323.1 universal stress protein [Leptolyngbya cf. ectocarpi LEGE 11479]